MSKHQHYQDYVIRDGKFIGDFEGMYHDFEDPWKQTIMERETLEKYVAIEIVKLKGYKRVLELGCGLGDFTARLKLATDSALGVDVSETAIKKAKIRHPESNFLTADILDFDVYRKFNPDCIIMAEITWYILDKIGSFKSFLQMEMKGKGLIHLLMTYREGEQKYGREYFTDLDGIMKYWNCVDFHDWGTFSRKEYNGGKRTYCYGVII